MDIEAVSYVLAAIYFCADFILVGIALPISKWIGRHLEMRKLRTLVGSLPPYPCLGLVLGTGNSIGTLEIRGGSYGAAGQLIGAIATFIVGELLKLVLIERLFDMTRAKLI